MFGSLFNNEDFEYPSCYIKKNVNGNGSFNSVERRVISIVFYFAITMIQEIYMLFFVFWNLHYYRFCEKKHAGALINFTVMSFRKHVFCIMLSIQPNKDVSDVVIG